MIVEVDGHKYSFEFEHSFAVADYAQPMSEKPGKERRRQARLAAKPDRGQHETEETVCFIRDTTLAVQVNGKSLAPVVASGHSRRFHTDPPNRDIARKYALQDALCNLFPSYGVTGALSADQATALNAANAQRRATVWEAWLNRRPPAEWEGDARVPHMVDTLLKLNFTPEDLRAAKQEQRRQRRLARRQQLRAGG